MASQAEISNKLGISSTTFKDFLARGIIEERPKGQYTLEDCAKQYLNHLREIAAGRMTTDGLSLQDERARLAKEQADAKEMENAIARGELVYISEIVKEFESQLVKARTKLLAVPTKVAAEANAAATVKEVQNIVESAIIEALSELVGYDKEGSSEEVKTSS